MCDADKGITSSDFQLSQQEAHALTSRYARHLAENCREACKKYTMNNTHKNMIRTAALFRLSHWISWKQISSLLHQSTKSLPVGQPRWERTGPTWTKPTACISANHVVDLAILSGLVIDPQLSSDLKIPTVKPWHGLSISTLYKQNNSRTINGKGIVTINGKGIFLI